MPHPWVELFYPIPLQFLVAILFAAAIALVYAAFVRDLATAFANLTGRSQTIETDFGRIEYARIGHGPPVLVIHGAAGGFDQGLAMVGGLADRGYAVVALSRFGYLRSSARNEMSVAMQADAYVALLDRLRIERAAVIAISAGAWSAVDFAIRYPGRCARLVLIVPAAPLPSHTRNFSGPLARAILESDFVAWTATKLTPLLPATFSRTMLGVEASILSSAAPEEGKRIRALLDHLLPISVRSAGIAFDIQTAASPPPLDLKAIGCPTLAISSADDPFGTQARASEIATEAPQGHALAFPTGGHTLVGHFHEVTSAVLDFIASPAG